MNSIDLLILQGPPGAGKSSLASKIASELRSREIIHTIIELDALANIYPISLNDIMYKNLAAIWPNYKHLGEIKVIIPTYLQAGEREIVLEAAPADRTTICEVIVPLPELLLRIADREQDSAATDRLSQYVRGYENNRTPDEFVDFKVSNFNKSLKQVAQEITKKTGWIA
jgi:hypothetical protein